MSGRPVVSSRFPPQRTDFPFPRCPGEVSGSPVKRAGVVRGSFPLKFAFVPLAILAASSTCGGDELTLPDEGNPASLELVSGRGQNGTVGQPLSDTLIVSVTDSKDRPVSGQAVVFALTGNSQGDVIPDTATTDDAGLARSRWVLGTTSGTQTLQARVVGFSNLTLDFSAQALPDAAANVVLVSGDGQNGIVGSTLADSLVVRVVDGFDNGVPGIAVDWAAVGGGSVSDASTTTDANGRTGVTRTLGSGSGPQSTTATVAGVGGSPVTFTHQAGSGSATDLELVSGDDQQGPAGFPVGAPLVVKLVDTNGNGVPGIPVTWVIGTGGGSVIPPTGVTDANGLASTNWTLGPAAGSNSLNATAAGFIVPFSATGTAAAPTQMAANSTTNQTGTAGLAAPSSPSVRVSDVNDNAVQGVGVTFTVTQGGGSVSHGTVGTDANGIATLPTWTLGAAVGPNQLEASVAGLAGSPVAFNATGNPGAPSSLQITTQPPANVQSGAAFAVAPVIQLLDATSNPVPAAGVDVTVDVTGGGATLNGTLTQTTNAIGVATFAGLSLVGPSGSYTLDFDASGLTGATSTTVTVGAGAPSKLSVMTQPSGTATSGQPFVQQPVIEIQDAAGNVVANPSFAVTAAIASGSGTLGGQVSVNSVNGVAAFTDLNITGSSGAKTLAFTASGLTGATSGTITLGAGNATQIAINGGNNGSAPAGSAVSPAPSVIVRDAQNNPVAGVSVTFQIATGGGSVSGGSPQVVATNTSGIAQVGTWTLGPIAGTNTLTAAATGLSGSPVTFSATATVGTPATITKSGGDNLTGPINSTLGTPHEVFIADVNGNGVPGVSVNWSEGDNGSVTPTTSTTDGAGHATATRTLGSTAGPQSTTASVSGLGSVTFNITATTGGASQMDPAGGDDQTAAAGSVLPLPLQVLVTDVGDNPVAGVDVTWTVLSGGGSVTSPSVTNASGIASATWTLGQTITGSGIQTMRASAAGSPVNFVATAIPGPVDAGNSSVVLSPSTITASSGSSASTVTVTAHDQFDNAIPGASVVLSASGSGNVITQPSATGAGGSTTGTISSTAAQSKTVTASINGTQVTQSPTLTVTPASASHLSIQSQPGGGVTAGQPLVPAPAFSILDPFGNRVTSATNGVTVTIGTNPAGGTLGGTVVVNASGGIALFDNLTLDKVGNGYTLVATASGLTPSPPTSSISVGSAGVSASVSTVTASPGTIVASTGSSASTVTVTALDAFGNPVSSAPVSLSATGVSNFGSGSSNGSGVYSASLFTTSTGLKTISAIAGGVSLTAAPTVTVNPAPANPATSTATITPASVTAGNPVSIVVQARDQFDNIVNIGGETVAVQVSGSNSVTPSVGDVGDGTYTSTYTPTSSGNDNIAITMNGTPISGSPFTQPVTTGPASGTQSSAIVPPSGSAGTPIPISIITNDQAGNLVTTGGAAVNVSITGANTVAAAVTDNDDGTYDAQYTPVASGTDNVGVTVNGTSVPGNPFAIIISAGGPSPPNTIATVPSGTAGAPTGITVQARDANDNDLTTGGASVIISVSGSNPATPAVNDPGDGTYTASYDPTISGTDNIAITLNGTPISGSPYSSSVAPGPPDPLQSVASVPAGTVAQQTTIVVTTFDAFNNPVTTGGATVVVTITGTNPASPITATDNLNGTYTAVYTPTVVGTDTIDITLNGTAIQGSPYTSVVN